QQEEEGCSHKVFGFLLSLRRASRDAVTNGLGCLKHRRSPLGARSGPQILIPSPQSALASVHFTSRQSFRSAVRSAAELSSRTKSVSRASPRVSTYSIRIGTRPFGTRMERESS